MTTEKHVHLHVCRCIEWCKYSLGNDMLILTAVRMGRFGVVWALQYSEHILDKLVTTTTNSRLYFSFSYKQIANAKCSYVHVWTGQNNFLQQDLVLTHMYTRVQYDEYWVVHVHVAVTVWHTTRITISPIQRDSHIPQPLLWVGGRAHLKMITFPRSQLSALYMVLQRRYTLSAVTSHHHHMTSPLVHEVTTAATWCYRHLMHIVALLLRSYIQQQMASYLSKRDVSISGFSGDVLAIDLVEALAGMHAVRLEEFR